MTSRSRWNVEYQRKPLSRSIKSYVWSMTYGKCWYCGVNLNPFENFVVEHVVPLCRGGTDDIDNLVPGCNYCNQAKATRTPNEWREQHDPEDCWFLEDGLFWFERSMDSRVSSDIVREVKDRPYWRELSIQAYYTYGHEPGSHSWPG